MTAPDDGTTEMQRRIAAGEARPADQFFTIQHVIVDARWLHLLRQDIAGMGENVITEGAFAQWARELSPQDVERLVEDARHGRGPFAECAPDMAAGLAAMLPELEDWRRERALKQWGRRHRHAVALLYRRA